MGLILDTSALVALERREANLQLLRDSCGEEPVAIPAVVWAELLAGVRLAKSAPIAARRRARVEELRRHIPLIPFDEGTAEHYADIFTECQTAGTPIPQNDMAVAATARQLGYRVLLGPQDEAHFRRVQGLELVVLSAKP